MEKEKSNEAELKIAKESAKKTYDAIKETVRNIISKVPQVKVPKFNSALLEIPESTDVIREKNAWVRHSELMNTQGEIFKIQEKILDEQKSTSRMTRAILLLTILLVILTGILAIPEIIKSIE